MSVSSFIFLCFTLASNIYILSFAKGNIFVSTQDVPTGTVALVFGGGMKKDGVTMSEMQEDRVKRGIELYTAGKVQTLFMTGDDGANNADEVSAMKKYAIDAGVPESAIQIDPHGYNTYKSCERAAQVYHITNTIVISQDFHLPRIIYFCSRQGIQVVGVSATLREYGLEAKIWPQGLREWLARVKAVAAGQSQTIGNVVVY